MSKKGDTIFFEKPVFIKSYSSCVGTKEGEGPLGKYFDHVAQENRFGMDTWEKAETRMIEIAVETALKKGEIKQELLDFATGGDLLNQCTSTSFAMRSVGAPFFGLYGACSTMAESMILGSMILSAGYGKFGLCTAASHFCSAERQYRYPLEYGGQRPPTAQWTATAAGAVIICPDSAGVRITAATVGRIYDPGIKDASNMGAAMAQSAFETLSAYFKDSGTDPSEYDLIITGDLADIGKGVVKELFRGTSTPMGNNYEDCGCLLYDQSQDVCAGASGCGCSAAVLTSHILPQMESGRLKRVLFCGTGALLSPLTTNQGESIPGICHLVLLEA